MRLKYCFSVLQYPLRLDALNDIIIIYAALITGPIRAAIWKILEH